ncbi:hypothetical protein [Agrococcus sp. SGAir0287]|uniref:hypothetical protein n=1 Tax=Agrococcus sp. SGAir0287 TaxID=2070347 RepID=UPI0010F6E14C|nr:hypothetical protein [Agrococcus sp. SGAir0287]
MDDWIWSALTALAAGLVGAAVSIFVALRDVRFRAVLEQRQLWREALRTDLPFLLTTRSGRERRRLREAIFLRLNPYKDQSLLRAIDDFLDEPSSTNSQRVTQHAQAMLKHDWERAKLETRFWAPLSSGWADLRIARQRRKYGEYERSRRGQ